MILAQAGGIAGEPRSLESNESNQFLKTQTRGAWRRREIEGGG
jgi:hypothetical protein